MSFEISHINLPCRIFSVDGDENGVFYWIATNGRTERWQNPHKSGKINISSSAPISRYTRPEMLVNRTYATISFVSGNQHAPAWWSVDLGPNRSLTVSRYSMHICSNPNNEARVADWCLQVRLSGLISIRCVLTFNRAHITTPIGKSYVSTWMNQARTQPMWARLSRGP